MKIRELATPAILLDMDVLQENIETYQDQCDLFGKENVRLKMQSRGGGGTDMGNVGAVMPAIQPLSTGVVGDAHTPSYRVAYPEYAVFHPAVVQAAMACVLLEKDGARAKEIVAEYKPLFASIGDYLTEMEKICRVKNGVDYHENNTASLHW